MDACCSPSIPQLSVHYFTVWTRGNVRRSGENMLWKEICQLLTPGCLSQNVVWILISKCMRVSTVIFLCRDHFYCSVGASTARNCLWMTSLRYPIANDTNMLTHYLLEKSDMNVELAGQQIYVQVCNGCTCTFEFFSVIIWYSIPYIQKNWFKAVMINIFISTID